MGRERLSREIVWKKDIIEKNIYMYVMRDVRVYIVGIF